MNTLKVGDLVPNFSCPDETGTVHSLEDYRGKKLVIFFYPKASTPGCTAEACDLRDHYSRIRLICYGLWEQRFMFVRQMLKQVFGEYS